jgi:transposase-like protein
MMAERGVSVDHSTIYRWVQRYEVGPEVCARDREAAALALAATALGELAGR